MTNRSSLEINQTSGFMLDMVALARHGKLAIPQFQRPYIWSQEDVIEFLDSMVHRWPVGGFFTWMPRVTIANDVMRPLFGPDAVDTGSARSLLLDGQNRILTLTWAMTDLSNDVRRDTLAKIVSAGERDVWCGPEMLVAFPFDNTFAFVDPEQVDPDTMLPATLLFDNSALHRHYLSSPREDLPEALLDAVDDMMAALRESRITLTEFHTNDIGEVRKAFHRICRAGVPMSEEDLERSIAWFDTHPSNPEPGR